MISLVICVLKFVVWLSEVIVVCWVGLVIERVIMVVCVVFRM